MPPFGRFWREKQDIDSPTACAPSSFSLRLCWYFSCSRQAGSSLDHALPVPDKSASRAPCSASMGPCATGDIPCQSLLLRLLSPFKFHTPENHPSLSAARILRESHHHCFPRAAESAYFGRKLQGCAKPPKGQVCTPPNFISTGLCLLVAPHIVCGTC